VQQKQLQDYLYNGVLYLEVVQSFYSSGTKAY